MDIPLLANLSAFFSRPWSLLVFTEYAEGELWAYLLNFLVLSCCLENSRDHVSEA